MAISPNILPHVERVAQFRLGNDLYAPALLCYDRHHLKASSPFPALFAYGTEVLFIYYHINGQAATLVILLILLLPPKSGGYLAGALPLPLRLCASMQRRSGPPFGVNFTVFCFLRRVQGGG